MASQEREQLDTKGAAKLLGVSPETVTRYRSADRAARYGFPEPDGHIGGRPWWWSTKIEAWRESRPGMGAGAGRPRKAPQPPA